MFDKYLVTIYDASYARRVYINKTSCTIENRTQEQSTEEVMAMETMGVNVKTAAEMTSLSPHTIRTYVRAGKLKAVRVGRRVIIPLEALKELMRG